ncbi:MAG: hypothetical protein VW582_10305, partial [Rhodospirillaceae bacterium]
MESALAHITAPAARAAPLSERVTAEIACSLVVQGLRPDAAALERAGVDAELRAFLEGGWSERPEERP